MVKRLLYLFTFLLTLFSQAQDSGIEFDGVDDYIQTNTPGIDGWDERTVEAWIKTTV